MKKNEDPRGAQSGQRRPKTGGAVLVASGIFLSRIAGLLRERALAHYFGNSDTADAFKAALRIPNFLQNLFGEGVLSASFIPVYAQKLAENNEVEARKIASTIASLLFLATSILVLLGTLATPILIGLIAPGFPGEKRDLTIKLVQILFPGTGLLVMSAWCLGILNSHRRFFLSYFAPVVWNGTIILALLVFGPGREQASLAVIAAWALVLGSLLQVLVQLPRALSLLGKFSFEISHRLASVRTVLKNFVPAVVGRGVVQVSAYVDNMIASLLPTGAVSAMSFAQQIYLLPVSLFGMSISAAELPNFSSATGTDEEIRLFLRERLAKSLRQVAFLIVPSALAFLFVGRVIVALLYQTGEFDSQSTHFVWIVLMGYSLGLTASTQSRLYSSAFYSLKDARTPLRFAITRVLIASGLASVFALYLPSRLGWDVEWATFAITASASVAGWIEFIMLRRTLQHRIGKIDVDLRFWAKLFLAGALASGLAWLTTQIADLSRIVEAVLTLATFGLVYLGTSVGLAVPEGQRFLRRLIRR